MPQKHPPASTAVSRPAFCAGCSPAGGGIGTADSACAANGANARIAARRRAERRIMMCVPGEDFVYGGSPSYTEEIGRWLHTLLLVCVRGASLRFTVMAGLVPAIPIHEARSCKPKRDHRDKAGHDDD